MIISEAGSFEVPLHPIRSPRRSNRMLNFVLGSVLAAPGVSMAASEGVTQLCEALPGTVPRVVCEYNAVAQGVVVDAIASLIPNMPNLGGPGFDPSAPAHH